MSTALAITMADSEPHKPGNVITYTYRTVKHGAWWVNKEFAFKLSRSGKFCGVVAI